MRVVGVSSRPPRGFYGLGWIPLPWRGHKGVRRVDPTPDTRSTQRTATTIEMSQRYARQLGKHIEPFARSSKVSAVSPTAELLYYRIIAHCERTRGDNRHWYVLGPESIDRSTFDGPALSKLIGPHRAIAPPARIWSALRELQRFGLVTMVHSSGAERGTVISVNDPRDLSFPYGEGTAAMNGSVHNGSRESQNSLVANEGPQSSESDPLDELGLGDGATESATESSCTPNVRSRQEKDCASLTTPSVSPPNNPPFPSPVSVASVASLPTLQGAGRVDLGTEPRDTSTRAREGAGSGRPPAVRQNGSVPGCGDRGPVPETGETAADRMTGSGEELSGVTAQDPILDPILPPLAGDLEALGLTGVEGTGGAQRRLQDDDGASRDRSPEETTDEVKAQVQDESPPELATDREVLLAVATAVYGSSALADACNRAKKLLGFLGWDVDLHSIAAQSKGGSTRRRMRVHLYATRGTQSLALMFAKGTPGASWRTTLPLIRPRFASRSRDLTVAGILFTPKLRAKLRENRARVTIYENENTDAPLEIRSELDEKQDQGTTTNTTSTREVVERARAQTKARKKTLGPNWWTEHLPNALDHPDFVAAFHDWMSYRREAGVRTYKPRGLIALFTRLSNWGVESAVEAIRYSMSQGYQGIFEERKGTTSNRRSAQTRKKRERNIVEDATTQRIKQRTVTYEEAQ